jgi:hypothetical protein
MTALAELTRQSRHDHKAACPSCFEAASAGILNSHYRSDEAHALFLAAIEQADKSNERPNWADIRGFLVAALTEHQSRAHRPGESSVPGLAMLLSKLGHAANAAAT